MKSHNRALLANAAVDQYKLVFLPPHLTFKSDDEGTTVSTAAGLDSLVLEVDDHFKLTFFVPLVAFKSDDTGRNRVIAEGLVELVMEVGSWVCISAAA